MVTTAKRKRGNTRYKLIFFVCLVLLTAVFVTCLVVVWKYHQKDSAGKDVIRKCKELELGMTREEVEAIMGQPMNVLEHEDMGRQKQTLYYFSRPLASTWPYCVLDKESGLVEEVVCDEGYKLKEDAK